MHKTVESANFHAAILGRIVTIVRGDQAFTMPVSDLEELADVLEILLDEEDADQDPVLVVDDIDATLLVDEDEEDSAEEDSGDEAQEETAALAAQDSDASSDTRPARRGRMWKAVKSFLSENDRARGYNALLSLVKRDGLTEGDPDHALKILLGRKLNAGELALTPAGRYKLVEKKDRQRGNVWASIRGFLGRRPHGATLEDIVAAAEAGEWTRAKNSRTAVTRALKRYSDSLSNEEGLFALAATVEGD